MKINTRSACVNRGHVLITAMVIVGVLLIGIAADLSLISYQFKATVRSAAWNKAIAVAEAGIEEAYAHINVNGFDNYSANGWAITTNGYWKQRSLGSNYYFVTIVTNGNPSFVSDGYVTIPPSTNSLKRTVQVALTSQGIWRGAMLARETITLNGNGVSSDSFNSTNTAFSTNGQYDPSKRAANGDIASNSRLPNCINIGNGDIYGSVDTGPNGTVSIRNGSVGDLAWHAAGRSGVQPDYSRNDMNVAFKDVVIPSTIPDRGSAGSGRVDGVTYVMIMGSHNYVLSSLSLSGQSKVLVSGNATLYISEDISMTGQSSITIATNASLTIYMSGASASFGGNGVLNSSGKAANFQYLGTPQNTSISLSGNSAFAGCIYAPNAALSLSGGGNDNLDFIGSTVSRSVSMNGQFNFHYDESIGNTNVFGWAIASWNEL